ncbi:hypothetical protein CKY47_35595 [Saccharothrix yanglingensis]|uniref:Uncharacterized protein n=1 Tax=Saccharothrix yanglingensis TaxID=659496 RepID=A0ABU0XAJ7_9PSEU|nr:hypothetical protein [Saccharothrix yanglingensis]
MPNQVTAATKNVPVSSTSQPTSSARSGATRCGRNRSPPTVTYRPSPSSSSSAPASGSAGSSGGQLHHRTPVRRRQRPVDRPGG